MTLRQRQALTELPDVVEGVDGGRQAAVQTEDLVLDDRRQRQVVEQVREQLPHVARAVLSHTLVEKAVNLRDLPTLVVATEQMDAVGVPRLVAQQQTHRLHRVVAAVDVVAHEKVVRVRWLASDLEELQQVVQLAVHIAADRHRASHGLHV